MRYCKRCVMPDTRPGIFFDDNGVCQACKAHDAKLKTDWAARKVELETLCNKYRGSNGSGPDCIIAVSGGKDSHAQTWYMKEVMGMNPLLVSVEDNLPMTQAGMHNVKNISEAFSCHIISLKPNLKVQKRLMRKTFERYGKPTWFIDRLIYTYPLHMALRWNTPLVVYGENISYEYGGADRVESYSARNQLSNGVASDIDFAELVDDVITPEALDLCKAPTLAELQRLDPIYLSYFIPWSSVTNYKIAKRHGFRDLHDEWNREHTFENFDQIESPAYLVHPWLKYPKFGHGSATDYASRFIRYGLLTRPEAIELVKKHDHRLDKRSLREFCEFLGYTECQFWDIIDGLYNAALFDKDEYGEWHLKAPIYAS